MSTAASLPQRTAATTEDTNDALPAEVLVLFGLTGGLAKVVTFHSLTRQDGVEETWRVVEPVPDDPPPARPYEIGTWGPALADDLVRDRGGWRGPWVAS